jgi:hypothetical protein
VLRDIIEKSARYPTRLGFLSDNHLGAPWRRGDRRQFLLNVFDAARASVAASHKSDHLTPDELDVLTADRVDAYIDDIIKRVTEKSAGLMQALAILAAVIALMMSDLPPILVIVAYATLSLTLFTTLLLLINTSLFWHRERNIYTDLRMRLEHGYAVLLERAHRLRLAQWLALLCFAGVFAETLRRMLVALNATEFFPALCLALTTP